MPTSLLVTKVSTRIKLVLQIEELGHPEEVWLAQRDIQEFVLVILKINRADSLYVRSTSMMAYIQKALQGHLTQIFHTLCQASLQYLMQYLSVCAHIQNLLKSS